MVFRPKSFYDELILSHGLRIFDIKYYDSYTADCGTIMAEEIVYVLQARGSKSKLTTKLNMSIEQNTDKQEHGEREKSSYDYHTDIQIDETVVMYDDEIDLHCQGGSLTYEDKINTFNEDDIDRQEHGEINRGYN